MFRKIVQRWNIVKSDLAEYRHLCQDCSGCWDRVERARSRITKIGCVPSGKESCCIRAFWFGDSWAERSEHLTLIYCDSFRAEIGTPYPCIDVNCPYNNANREYVRAVADYKAALARRRAFWKQKENKAK